MSTATATPKQVAFLRRLVEERPEILGDLDIDQWFDTQKITLLSVRDISKVIDTVKSIPVPRRAEYAHLPEGHVIVNKRAGECPLCGSEVEVGTGYAVSTTNGWRNYHRLNECPKRVEVTIPEGRYALPSATGNNDLDFFKVTVRGTQRKVYRVVGGHPDLRLGSTASREALERLSALSDDELHESSALFGQSLGYCGKCGRHLTDEASRARGLGPDCASK